MKISSIKLNNITSFRGDHEINFKAMTRQSDLFAITGPTGAGKSTLLSAMAMALYSKNIKGLAASDLITNGEAAGSITLCLEIAGDQYRIEWSCRVLKKDGSPRATPLTNSRLYKNGEATEEKIGNILNLDFDQYNQVIVLNQGKFSEFLTASFSDRKNILENLLGHRELKNLGKKVRSEKSRLETQISNLKEQSEQAQLLTPEELKGIKNELKNAQLRQASLKEKAELTKAAAQELKEVTQLAIKEKKNKETIETYQSKVKVIDSLLGPLKSAYQAGEKQLNNDKRAYKKKRPILERARLNSSATASAQLEINSGRENLEDFSKRIKANSTDLESQNKELEDLKELVKRGKSLLEHFNGPTLKKCTEARDSMLILKENEAVCSIHTKNIEELKDQKKLIEKRAKDFNHRKIELCEKLYQYLPEGGRELSFEEITMKSEEYRVDFKQSSKAYIQVKELLLVRSNDLQGLQKQCQELEIKRQDYLKKQLSDKESLAAQQKKFKESQSSAKTIEDKLSHYQLLLSARAMIEKGGKESEDCPICSTSFNQRDWLHKFNELIPADLSILEEELKNQHNESEHYRKEIGQLEASLKLALDQGQLCQSQQEDLTQSIEKAKADIKLKQEFINKRALDSNDHLQEKLEVLAKIKSLDNEVQSERSSWLVSENNLKKLLATGESLEEQNKKIIESLCSTDLFKGKASEDSFSIYKDKTLEQLGLAIKELHQQEKYNDSIKRLQSAIKKIKTEQEQILEKSDHLKEMLLNKSKALSKLQEEKVANQYPDDPIKETQRLEETIEESSKKLEEAGLQKNKKQSEFEQNISQINLLQEQNKEMQQLRITYNEKFFTQRDLLKKIDSCLESYEDGSALTKLIENSDELSNTTAFIENVEIWSDYHKNSLLPLIDKMQEEISISTESISRCMTQVQQNNKQNKKITELLKRREEFITSLNSLLELEHYVGKDQFRDFTLAVLEQNLLKVANAEISSLADGRYKLIHAKAGKRSEFLVQDFWQGGLKRKVSTLSGGETFLLSLGLSLGLSEISRGQTEIDCFFIDEGFGTLDSECIQQVLDCLMTLQSRGKQIGLISHVQALTDQIPVRLELSKNNFGESSLRV